jgi:hypothetical protein
MDNAKDYGLKTGYTIYIKNRRNSGKKKGFRLVSKSVFNRKFGTSKSPTFHILRDAVQITYAF